MKLNKSLLRVASALCLTKIVLACGIAQQESPGTQSTSTESASVNKEVSETVIKDKFGKAYENLEFDFNDFLQDELGIWGSGDQSRYQAYKGGYDSLFKSIRIRPERLGEVDWYVDNIMRNKLRYQKIEVTTGVPWFWVGITHGLEASFDFRKHLHNGDLLTARTWQVPAGRPSSGRPPFSWEFSATDAILLKGYESWKNWDLASLLAFSFEKYNGFGYRSSRVGGINSPYLWSFSNHFTKGKYVADGVFDPNATSGQAGAMVILKRGLDRKVFQLVEEAPPAKIVSATASPALGEVLYQGMEPSENVLLLKLRLRSFGLNPGALDRNFDTNLTDAVAAFQNRVGVQADGAVGPTTWGYLWPSITNAGWLKAWSYNDGIDIRAMTGGRCVFKLVSKDSPALAGFMKSAISAKTVTFGGSSQTATMPQNCPDIREEYNLTNGTTLVNTSPVARFPGSGTAATWHSVVRASGDEWQITAMNAEKPIGTLTTRVKDDLVAHLTLHAKANSVVEKAKP